MPDVLSTRQAKGKLRASPKPTGGHCEGCGTRVGRNRLKWHHCHDCGSFVAWLCNHCNLSLTEHAIRHWDALERVHAHECNQSPRLFEVEPLEADPGPGMDGPTRRLYMSNGAGDGRYISASNIDGHITVEQFASVIGTNANTAREIASGRQSGQPIGTRIGGSWFISHDNVLAHLEKRWNTHHSPTSLTTPPARTGG